MRDVKSFVVGLLVLPTVILLVAHAFAGPVTVPHTFVAGTPALAEEVNANFAALAAQINDNDGRIVALEAALAQQTARLVAVEHTGAIYRWAEWSTYEQDWNWFDGNSGTLFGGVVPSNWGDNNGLASQLSSDKEVLRTLFCRKGYGGANAVVACEQWASYSSTNSRHAAALFRIRNTTAAAIDWTTTVHQTAYVSWSESASVALNGTLIWKSTADLHTSATQTHVLSIPPARVSTAIFIAGSGPASTGTTNTRALLLAFRGGCLTLPAGLEYVDDFDTATGDWSQ